MPLVLRMKKVTAVNENLSTLSGFFPNDPFGEVWIDFGVNDNNAVNWNKVYTTSDNGVYLFPAFLNLISNTGSKTGVSISGVGNDFENGASGDETGVIAPAEIADDYIYAGAYTSTGSPSGTIHIDGLNRKRIYNLEIFSHREDTGSPRTATFNANGVELQIDANASTATFTLQGVEPDENGRITLVATGTGSNKFAYLNFMKIIEQA